MGTDDLAKLVLRLTLGGLMLFHGVNKLIYGIGGVQYLVAQAGLPEMVAYGVYVGEIIAPVMLIVGWQVRVAALLIVINMFFALVLAHLGDLFALTSHGGWRLELQAFYLFTALAVLLLGAGRYAVQED
ncbi:MAG: DoxX family protein [Pseudomonadota bacterium]|nr:DoxX family protein [Pseudomonadota bacterium]